MARFKGFQKLVEDLPDIAKRWFESLTPMGDEAGENFSSVAAEEYFSKLRNLADENPEAFFQYEPSALSEILEESALGFSDIAVIAPENFRLLASRNLEKFLEEDSPMRDEILAKIETYADMYDTGIPFDEVPHLMTELYGDVAQVVGHEGRHRMRGLERVGSDKALVSIKPDSPMNVLSEADPQTGIHSELSSFQSGSEGGGQKIGTLEDLLKFLSLGGVSAGALENLTDE